MEICETKNKMKYTTQNIIETTKSTNVLMLKIVTIAKHSTIRNSTALPCIQHLSTTFHHLLPCLTTFAVLFFSARTCCFPTISLIISTSNALYYRSFAHLYTTVPPDILDYPTSTDMVVREGSNVTLKCAATGSPEPTITWRRENGVAIELANGTEGKYHTNLI